MRIQCPSCAAIYQVADALLDPPRTVRCAGCTHDWIATPMAEPVEPPAPPSPEAPAPEEAPAVHARAPEPEPPPEPAPLSAIERLAAAPEAPPAVAPAPRSRLLTAAWAASFAALALMGVAGYAKRDVLMEHWPASKLVYTKLGLVQMGDEKPPAH